MNIQRCILIVCSFFVFSLYSVDAQVTERVVKERLEEFLENYSTRNAHIGKARLDSFTLDAEQRKLVVYADATFAYQPFTQEVVEGVYRSLKQSLPGPVNYYDITLYSDGKSIQQLVPNALLPEKKRDVSRLWKKRNYEGNPWVKRTSIPYEVTHGLAGRHLAVWQSHGRYYKNQKDEWAWQRPRLYCTTEDLFTQSFVVPFIIPMLENAGAVVFTPRERDTQRQEVIVDNDGGGGIYFEEKSRKNPWTKSLLPGFAHTRTVYSDGESPFVSGTARLVPTAGQKKKTRTLATWIPDIPETGEYAVYVSYQSFPNSTDDARYVVFHKGGTTEFSVNQRMGGGTWVYLGIFEFDKGQNDYGFVALSNESSRKGIVSADAVRFGGGMGNVERNGKVSGMPRYLEGARYWAQWSGMPYDVYTPREGENDYADDINVRSYMSNYLSGGSVYNPAAKRGLRVPLEMTLGVHSDAGFSREDELIGTLGIYTTAPDEGMLAGGISRYTSRDLADLVLTGLKRDLTAYTGKEWPRRAMWNRNYSESRLPVIPSMILETLSHQNFSDMKWGHEPDFKFVLGRSVYKSILKYIATQHGEEYVVQPLPVNHFAIQFINHPEPVKKKGKKQKNATIELSWTPVSDPLEPTASPSEYVVYSKVGYGGFDNGTLVRGTSCRMEIEPGLVYSYKVTAVNAGGESFPSEILSVYQAPESNMTLLLVNGFDRLSGPATIETTNLQGFDLRRDPGIPYRYTTSYSGMQQSFNREFIGRETSEGLGYSGDELEGMRIVGNTFDYPFIHGKAIQSVGGYSFVSCSDEAVESGYVRLSNYAAIDYILGLERSGGQSAMTGEMYQALTPMMQQLLTNYLRSGGRLLMSGSSFLNDVSSTSSGQSFALSMLKCSSGGFLDFPIVAGQRDKLFTSNVRGTGMKCAIPRTMNEMQYAVPQPEVLQPSASAFPALVYEENDYCAAVAYSGRDYRSFVMGFPFESILNEKQRAQTMGAVLNFLFTPVK